MNIEYGDAKLVSIIMPAYNAADTIKQSINSVLNQTYPNWELIIIDDGSKDETIQIIEHFKVNNQRIKFYRNDNNLGVSETRNKGIDKASGNLIAFLDSDDMWVNEKLEKQIKEMKNLNSDFSFTSATFMDEENRMLEGDFIVPNITDYRKLKRHNVISCSSVMINKKFFKEHKMERDDIHEDYVLWLKILKQGNVAHGIKKPLLVYRISTTSKSGNKLKSIFMTYNVFRFIGINPIFSTYFTIRHSIGAFLKYRAIKSGEFN